MADYTVELHVLDDVTASLSINDDSPVNLSVGAEVIGGGIPYSGSYTVRPQPYAQTLETATHVLDRDIVVEAIPNNYGLITWNGTTITIS